MTQLSAEQALKLANEFRTLAAKTMEYRFSNYLALTNAEKEALELQENRLLNSANTLITAAVDTVLDEASASLTKITAATREAKKVVKKVARAKAVINVATNAAKLAAAIIAQDYQGIANAVKGTYDAAKKAVK